MKKTISFFLAVVLVLILPVFSYAVDTREYNWSDVNSRLPETLGDNALVCQIEEVDALITLPSSYALVALSEEDKADGCIGIAVSTENNSEYIMFYYTNADGITLNGLYAYFSQNGISADAIAVNGVPAILQRDEANNFLILTYLTVENQLFQIIFSPLSLEESLFEYIIASVRPHAAAELNVEPAESVADVPTPVNPVSGLISK